MSQSLTLHDSKLRRNQDGTDSNAPAGPDDLETSKGRQEEPFQTGVASRQIPGGCNWGQCQRLKRWGESSHLGDKRASCWNRTVTVIEKHSGFCQACQTQSHEFTSPLARRLSTPCEWIWGYNRSVLGKQRWANRWTEEKPTLSQIYPALRNIGWKQWALRSAFHHPKLKACHPCICSRHRFFLFFPQDFQAG